MNKTLFSFLFLSMASLAGESFYYEIFATKFNEGKLPLEEPSSKQFWEQKVGKCIEGYAALEDTPSNTAYLVSLKCTEDPSDEGQTKVNCTALMGPCDEIEEGDSDAMIFIKSLELPRTAKWTKGTTTIQFRTTENENPVYIIKRNSDGKVLEAGYFSDQIDHDADDFSDQVDQE